jgi:hypothetical protein
LKDWKRTKSAQYAENNKLEANDPILGNLHLIQTKGVVENYLCANSRQDAKKERAGDCIGRGDRGRGCWKAKGLARRNGEKQGWAAAMFEHHKTDIARIYICVNILLCGTSFEWVAGRGVRMGFEVRTSRSRVFPQTEV